jgi:hypothetical protein
MAEPHATVSGFALVGVAVGLGGAVFGPIALAGLCAVGGAGIAIGMRGKIPAVDGALHMMAGVINATAFVGVGAWYMASHWGLTDADWIVPCSVLAGAVGNRYMAALGLVALAWRKVRGGDKP